MERLILGTAGHIDHGKTALVQALTGVDTDRLPEEKARGITIDLGFAELRDAGGLQLGVVDVPGHEDFIRTMVAGASGMDLALLVVAADEGVMPQTREHFDIIRLLGVPSLVVALTKTDLVEEDWLPLVESDVRDLLENTPYQEAPMVATSTRDGHGVDALRATLLASARQSRGRLATDLARLPVDRAFTVQGTGTVVTGTLGSGTLSVGESVRILPSGPEARIRSVQVHGREVRQASAGERTAVALASTQRSVLPRGAVLVSSEAWEPTWMLTVRASMLEHTAWTLEHGQRVRVHIGTQEVMARCALLETGRIEAGSTGWVQLRLEAPAVARAGDRVVIRSYSPLNTIGGGIVAEPFPPKRRRADREVASTLDSVIDGVSEDRARAVIVLAGWSGVATSSLPLRIGCAPDECRRILSTLGASGAVLTRGWVVSAELAAEAEGLLLAVLQEEHAAYPLRPTVPLERLRASVPDWAAAGLADAVIGRLADSGALELRHGGARSPQFEARLNPQQEDACRQIVAIYAATELSPPFLDELPEDLRERGDLAELIRYLEGGGRLRRLDADLLIDPGALQSAETAVTTQLAGRTDLGPADFREVLPVSRRHLIPLLAHFDGLGVTIRRGGMRDVPGRP